jgi:hypothetical protein
MDIEIWNRYGNNTNTAEAAHSLVNRTGKQLKLLPAILRFVFNIFYIIENFNLIILKIF